MLKILYMVKLDPQVCSESVGKQSAREVVMDMDWLHYSGLCKKPGVTGIEMNYRVTRGLFGSGQQCLT